VWEWTSSLWGEGWSEPAFKYPYDPGDGRENLEAGDDVRRVVRGGSFFNNREYARCAFRYRSYPDLDWGNFGFRVVVSPISPASAL
jgi:iron(II)-dependent oxidoreductase